MTCAVVEFGGKGKKPRHYTNVSSVGMSVSRQDYSAKLVFTDGSTLVLGGATSVKEVDDTWLLSFALPMGKLFD